MDILKYQVKKTNKEKLYEESLVTINPSEKFVETLFVSIQRIYPTICLQELT